MVKEALIIRPAISWGGGKLGGSRLTCHDVCVCVCACFLVLRDMI